MLTIAKLFGKSPFAPLQTHMDKIALCLGKLPLLFDALLTQDAAKLSTLVETISVLEYEADLTKNDIRSHLPRSLFLPVDRGSLLEILELQDGLADRTEKIAVRASFLLLSPWGALKENFQFFCSKNLEAFHLVRQVVGELDELLACSFGGGEAEKVKGMTDDVAFCAYEVEKLEYILMREVYQQAEKLSVPAFHLWLTLIQDIGDIARVAEQLGNRIRMLLELH